MKYILQLFFSFLIGISLAGSTAAQHKNDINQRNISIAKNDWKLWLESKASYENDKLFLPPVNLSEIPTNIPTGGWNRLNDGKIIHLPATVEQYFWGQNGNPFGVSGDYIGVSWFSTSVTLPASLRNKRIQLYIESARVRAEIYVNQQLAGYNLVDGTPFHSDITTFLKLGAENIIAVRITDPNGDFTWCDWPLFKWGDYLNTKEVIDYREKVDLKTVWYGGNFFVKDNSYFEGLPTNTAFNWEYQCFSNYEKIRFALRIKNDATLMGAYADHRHELFSAVSIIPLGKGHIEFSTLKMLSKLQSNLVYFEL
jgi:hypothetical protein